MSVSIWMREGLRMPIKVDEANSVREAECMAHEYRMAIGCLPGQHRHGKDKVWAGRRDQEPKDEVLT